MLPGWLNGAFCVGNEIGGEARLGPVAAAPAGTLGVYGYFTPLTLLVYLALPHAPLLDIATSYMLKDRLHASATEVSLFRLLTALPVYLSMAFGFTRDLWNPLGLRDRGYFIIFGPLTGLVFLVMASVQLTYIGLFAGVFMAMFSFRFVAAAYQGLMALIGQEQLMSGRLAALWQIVLSAPYVAGAAFGGWVAEHLPPHETFLLLAAFSALIALFGIWQPRPVFEHTYDRPLARASDLWNSFVRLAKHQPAYAPVIIFLMFQFAPAFNTPLQFYLTNTLHASDAIYGYFNAIFYAAFVPVFFLYGWLCTRVSLEKLLWWGTVLCIPQMLPILFIHTPEGALWAALPMGLMGGVIGAAIYDLAMRACPPGLQGALMMMIEAASIFAMRGSDLAGAAIYNSSPQYGFLYSVIVTMAMYAAILPVLRLIPRELISSRDGEINTLIAEEEREAGLEMQA